MVVVQLSLYFFIYYFHNNYHFIVGINIIIIRMFRFEPCDYFSHKRARFETIICWCSYSADRACRLFTETEPLQYALMTKLMPTVCDVWCISEDATAYHTREIWCCRHERNRGHVSKLQDHTKKEVAASSPPMSLSMVPITVMLLCQCRIKKWHASTHVTLNPQQVGVPLFFKSDIAGRMSL